MIKSPNVAIFILPLLMLAVTAGCEHVGAASSNPEARPQAKAVGRQTLQNGLFAEVRGLRVVAAGRDADDMQMRAFNWNPGTTVAVSIVRPEGGIIGFDRDSSQVTSFHDGHGTDLWSGPQASKFSNSQLDMMPRVSNDGREILFEVDAQGVPRRGTKVLTLQAEIQLQVGSSQETVTAKGVTLESGTEFELGERTIEVTEAGPPSWGDDPFAATLKLQGGTSDINLVVFLDANGNELSSRRQSSFWSGSGEQRVDHWQYAFETKPTGPVEVVVTRWTDLNQITVPINLTFGAGL